MHDNRDPTNKCKHKRKAEDIISVILAIGISVLSIGLLVTLFKPGDTGSGGVKLEGSVGGSITVGGSVDKENTEVEEGTDTENDVNADTDTTPDDDISWDRISYDFTSDLEGVTYSENVDQENLWVRNDTIDGNSVLSIGKSTISDSAQKVWVDLSSVDATRNRQVLTFSFKWCGSENGLSEFNGANAKEWYTTFSLMSLDSTLLSIQLYASIENPSTYSIVVNNEFATNMYSINEWCDVRIEIENDVARILVNETPVRVVTYSATSKGVDTFEIKHRGYVEDTNFYVDNISFATSN